MKKFQIISFILIWIIFLYPNLPTRVVEKITNTSQSFSWEYVTSNYTKLVTQPKVFDRQAVLSRIREVRATMPDATDEETAQALQQLKDKHVYIFSDNLLYKVPNIWWYIVWSLIKTIWNLVFWLMITWSEIAGWWANYLTNNNWKIDLWVLWLILRWFVWIFIYIFLMATLMEVLKISIAYIRNCMRVFPRVLPNTISRAKWKMFSIVLMIIYVIILAYTSSYGISLAWIPYYITLLTNIIVVWVLIATMNNLFSILKEKKWIEKIVKWFKE